MAINYILPFDENVLNILTDLQYSSDSDRINGVSSGLARSNLHNKLFRQTSVVASMIGELIKNAGLDASDANITTLLSNYQSALSTLYLSLTGGAITGTVDHQRNIVYKPKFLNYSEVYATNATATGSVIIDMNVGNNHILTLTGNTTLTIANSPPYLPSGQLGTFTLGIIQTSTPRTLTFPASVKFPDDIQTDISTANRIYFLTFLTLDGGVRYYNIGFVPRLVI